MEYVKIEDGITEGGITEDIANRLLNGNCEVIIQSEDHLFFMQDSSEGGIDYNIYKITDDFDSESIGELENIYDIKGVEDRDGQDGGRFTFGELEKEWKTINKDDLEKDLEKAEFFQKRLNEFVKSELENIIELENSRSL